MIQTVFEQQIFELINQILDTTPNTLVVDTREGFDVFDNTGTKIFGITIVGLYAVIHIMDGVHSLSFDKADTIYNKCREKFMKQHDASVVKEQKRLLQNKEQDNSIAYLRRVVSTYQK